LIEWNFPLTTFQQMLLKAGTHRPVPNGKSEQK